MRHHPSLHCALRRLTALAVALLASACSSVDKPAAPSEQAPDFVVLDDLHAGRKVDAGALARMASYRGPQGQIVYVYTAMCCDQFNRAYDASGRYLCAPSGGFTGQGDGRCPAWVRRAIWGQPLPATAASGPSGVAQSL